MPFKTPAPIGAIALFLICISAPVNLGAQEEIDYKVEIVSADWNSLEIVKLVVSLLLPAAMLYVGLWMDRRIKEVEHRQWSNQKVIEKRLEVYEKITPKLNDIMCYFLRIGIWKERRPNDIIDMKREIDKIAYIYAPLFSPNFLKRYNEFMGLCYAMFRGDGKDAQLRTDATYYREAFASDDDESTVWQHDWDECFTGPEEAADRKEVSQGYRSLVDLIAAELGVGLE